MSDPCQSSVSVPSAIAGWPLAGRRSMAEPVSSSWPAEPSFAEIVSDPLFQQILASDRVTMESFNGLVAKVRQRLSN